MTTIDTAADRAGRGEAWEPWSPKIWDRVRVLSRPECLYCRESGDAEVGLTGTVYQIEEPLFPTPEPGATAHRYWVQFDAEVNNCDISHFAAIELESLPGGAGGEEEG